MRPLSVSAVIKAISAARAFSPEMLSAVDTTVSAFAVCARLNAPIGAEGTDAHMLSSTAPHTAAVADAP